MCRGGGRGSGGENGSAVPCYTTGPSRKSEQGGFQLSSSRPNCPLSPFPGPNSRLLGWDPASTLGISAMAMNREYLLRKRFRLDGSDCTLLGTEFDTIRRKVQTWNVEFAKHLRDLCKEFLLCLDWEAQLTELLDQSSQAVAMGSSYHLTKATLCFL